MGVQIGSHFPGWKMWRPHVVGRTHTCLPSEALFSSKPSGRVFTIPQSGILLTSSLLTTLRRDSWLSSFDNAGFGEPTQANNWVGYNYFQYGYDKQGPHVRPTSYVFKHQYVHDTFHVGSAHFPHGATNVPNKDEATMDGEFVFDIRNDDTFWNLCMQFRAFFLPTILDNQWGIAPHLAAIAQPLAQIGA